jgi:hypothetical protein
MAPIVRPAYDARQRRELAALAELAAVTPQLNGAYARARDLVLEGSTAEAAAEHAIFELGRLERVDRRAPEPRRGRDRRRPP